MPPAVDPGTFFSAAGGSNAHVAAAVAAPFLAVL